MKVEINNVLPKVVNKRLNKNSRKKSNNQFNNLLLNVNGKDSSKNKPVLHEKEELRKISDDDLKNIKDELKKAGFSKEEVDKIEDLDDLKDFCKKAEEEGDINSLLNIISLISNVINKNSNTDFMKDVLKKLDGINDLVNKFVECKVPMEKQQISKEILEKIQLVLKNQEGSDFDKSIIKTIFNKLVKSENEVGNNVASNISSIESELKTKLQSIFNKLDDKQNNKLQTINSAENNLIKNSKDLSKDSSSLSDGQAKNNKGEDDFLSKFVDNEKQSNGNEKIDKAVNFMSHFKTQDNMPLTSKADIENVVLNKATINDDMIKAIKYMEVNSVKELAVKIMPKELGEVIIKLTMEGGIMKANINASNKDAYNILNNNLSQIQEKLQANNLKVQDISLNIYNEDTTFFKEGSNNNGDESNRQNNKKRSSSSKINSLNESEREENISSLENNVNMLA